MIKVGNYVIIQKIGGDHLRLNRVHKGQKILIEKLKFEINGAIDKPYGLFEASAHQLTPVVQLPTVSTLAEVILHDEVAVNEIDNIVALSAKNEVNVKEEQLDAIDEVPKKRQKLTHVEISALKQAGISKLVDGNAAFNNRTEYSQLKYVQKKTKKHSDRVLITQPNIRLLVECYYKRSPDRIAHLRIDLLGYVLQMSAVHVGCRVFVYEQVLGLLGAAVIERLGGKGACIFLHRYEVPQSIPCIYAMEFNEKLLSTFHPFRISTFLGKSSSNAQVTSLVEKEEKSHEKAANTLVENCKEEDENLDLEADLSLEERRRIRAEKEAAALDILSVGSSGFDDCGSLDCIILALRTADAIDILEKAYKSLRFCGTIVVYSAVQTQAIKAYEWLKSHGAVDLQVFDQFYRGYQVLPDRTHPLMQQPIASGFVLSGIKVKERNA